MTGSNDHMTQSPPKAAGGRHYILNALILVSIVIGVVAAVYSSVDSSKEAEQYKEKFKKALYKVDSEELQKSEIFEDKQQCDLRSSNYYNKAEEYQSKAEQLEQQLRNLSNEIVATKDVKSLISKIPVGAIVDVHSSAQADPNKDGSFVFSVWLSGLEKLPSKIKEVRYHFAQQSFKQKPEVSRNKEDGFLINHSANGCLSNLIIDVVLAGGDTNRFSYDMCRGLGWDAEKQVVRVKRAQIYLQRKDECIEKDVRAALKDAVKEGYKFSFISLKTNVITPEVRYFHDEDSKMAEKVADGINGGMKLILSRKAKAIYVGKNNKGQPLGLLEIWFPGIGYCKVEE